MAPQLMCIPGGSTCSVTARLHSRHLWFLSNKLTHPSNGRIKVVNFDKNTPLEEKFEKNLEMQTVFDSNEC